MKKYSDYIFSLFEEQKLFMNGVHAFEQSNLNHETKDVVHNLLYEGGHDGFSVNNRLIYPDNAFSESNRRLDFASMAINSPECFESIKKNGVNLFHGTNSNALADILKNGLYSEEKILTMGKNVSTGEGILGRDSRDFVSLTDDMELALKYAMHKPFSDAKHKESFGVILGVSSEELEEDRKIQLKPVRSITREIGVKDHLPIEKVKFISVPKEKISQVQKMFKKYKITHIDIVPSESMVRTINDANQYKGGFPPKQTYNEDCLYINGTREEVKNFNEQDLGNLAKTRKLFKIKELFSKIKNSMKNIVKDALKNDEYTRDE